MATLLLESWKTKQESNGRDHIQKTFREIKIVLGVTMYSYCSYTVSYFVMRYLHTDTLLVSTYYYLGTNLPKCRCQNDKNQNKCTCRPEF